MRSSRVLTLLHTSPRHVDLFDRLFADLAADRGCGALPDIRLSLRVRDDLLQQAIASGALPAEAHARAVDSLHDVTAASDAVLCTCSTLGPAADEVACKTDTPVLRIDTPMAQEAARLGRAITVVATLTCTLQPTCDLIAAHARRGGTRADITPVHVAGAWQAFAAGNIQQMHARIVEDVSRAAQAGVDAVVLAQASMADAIARHALIGTMRTDMAFPVPVLTSPVSGLAAAVAAVTARA